MEFKYRLEDYVKGRKDYQPDEDRCVKCGGVVRLYFKTVAHHPRVCEPCVKILYHQWEFSNKLD